MAYDETLAQRVRDALVAYTGPGITERRMFGGLAFMLDGNMCCCVTDPGLMTRVGPDAYAAALAQPHARLGAGSAGRPGHGRRPVGTDWAGHRVHRHAAAQIGCRPSPQSAPAG